MKLGVAEVARAVQSYGFDSLWVPRLVFGLPSAPADVVLPALRRPAPLVDLELGA